MTSSILPSVVLDVLVLAIIVICAVAYWRRGFAAGFVKFLGTLVALVMSVILSGMLAPKLFEMVLQKPLTDKTLTLVEEQGISGVREVLSLVAGFLPGEALDSAVASLGESMSEVSSSTAAMIVKDVIAPLVTPFIGMLVFLVCFFLLRFVLRILGKLLKGINNIPVMGDVNKILGFAIGILIGIMNVFVLLCIIWGVDAVYGGGYLGREYFSSSIVYRMLGSANVFL